MKFCHHSLHYNLSMIVIGHDHDVSCLGRTQFLPPFIGVQTRTTNMADVQALQGCTCKIKRDVFT